MHNDIELCSINVPSFKSDLKSQFLSHIMNNKKSKNQICLLNRIHSDTQNPQEEQRNMMKLLQFI